jgi:hypothetical protein
MAKRALGKAIGADRARKLVRDVGGAPDPELCAELERVLGFKHSHEVYRLSNGGIVDISYGSGRVFVSREQYRRLLAHVGEIGKRKPQHPLGKGYPNGHGFIDAVPQLAQELYRLLLVRADALNGSVASLEHIDKAARRFEGQHWLEDPTMLAPIVAYVGETMRHATAGRWQIRSWNLPDAKEADRWEPVIVGADGRQYHPFGIFKELLERGSVRARVEYDIGAWRTAQGKDV